VSGIGVTCHWWLAGVESTVPASFFARTSSSCQPGRTSRSWYGVTQDPNVAPSSAHSKVASGSFEVNSKSAHVFTVGVSGPKTIVVSGAVTVHR
jgi:hypothetical protein